MIETIIPALNIMLETTNYFEKQFELVEQVVKQTRDGNVFIPAQYCSFGQFEDVNDFDNYNGISYWRKNGDVSFVDADEDSFVSCSNLMDVNIPLKLIAIIPRTKLKTDDAYSDERTATRIIKTLSGKNSALKTSLNAQWVDIIPNSYTTDNKQILNEEYNGIDIQIRHEFVYLSVNITIDIRINKKCIIAEC